jgi:hypothetical protein
MHITELSATVQGFNRYRIAAVGDLMLDEYLCKPAHCKIPVDCDARSNRPNFVRKPESGRISAVWKSA